MPPNVSDAVGGWSIVPCLDAEQLVERLAVAEVVLIDASEAAGYDRRALSDLLDQVDRSGSVAVVLVPESVLHTGPLASRRGQFLLVPDDIAPAELAARVETAATLQPAIRELRNDVTAVRTFGAGIGQDFEQLDEEMRLAARLQRDFLPKTLPQVGPVRFASLFRPASWVSGDIYDVFRLDETHVGFYVADVVGHGMPAALLTMFVKKSLQTKRIAGNTYEIIPPSEALAQLNEDICQQDLSSCQFCTAVYAIVDTENMTLHYARGGHPPALLLGGDGRVEQLQADGPLLGVFPDEIFQPRQIPLTPGDRVVIYSDGAEDTLADPSLAGPAAVAEKLRELRDLPPEEMVLQLAMQMDQRRAYNDHDDDITVLVMDILDDGRPRADIA